MAGFQHSDWPDPLWIIRHGQSAGNVARDAAELARTNLIDVTTRDADTPLSELGHEQSRARAIVRGHAAGATWMTSSGC